MRLRETVVKDDDFLSAIGVSMKDDENLGLVIPDLETLVVRYLVPLTSCPPAFGFVIFVSENTCVVNVRVNFLPITYLCFTPT